MNTQSRNLYLFRRLWQRLLTFGMVYAVVAGAMATPATAQFGLLYDWNNPAGGAYSTSSNWAPTGIPDTAIEGANFGLNATYDVNLAVDTTVGGWGVGGGHVSFNGSGATNYSAATFDVNSAPAATATIELNAVRPTISGPVTIGGATSSNATVVVAPSGQLSGASAMTLGGAGHGRLEVQVGLIAPLGGGFSPRNGKVAAASAALGQAVGGVGVADVAGQLTIDGELIIGDAGQGTVNLLAVTQQPGSGGPVRSAGVLLSGSGVIAGQPGSIGLVNANSSNGAGPGVRWDMTGSLAIGGTSSAAGGSGRLELASDAEVHVGTDLRIWSGGSLAVTAGGSMAMLGAAHLGGALEFFAPQIPMLASGVEYKILTASEVLGTFSSVSLPPLTGSRTWSLEYRPTEVTLRIVPAAADFDEDGDVDAMDLLKWKTGFGTFIAATHMQGDANRDGDSDGVDFLVWQQQFGTTLTTAAIDRVPEPGSALLSLVVFVAAVCQRSRPHRQSTPSDGKMLSRTSSVIRAG